MKTYGNITDFLTAHLFVIDEVGEYYFKYYAPNQRHEIPFAALAGHTVESFQALAEREGWIKKTEAFSKLGKSAQVAGLHLSSLVQAWAALAREEEKKRLDQRAREQL